ncbi:hypothetical protein D3C72_2124700 [compost metagenome]
MPQPRPARVAMTNACASGTQCTGGASVRRVMRAANRACNASLRLNTNMGAVASAAAVTPWAKWRCMNAGLASAL